MAVPKTLTGQRLLVLGSGNTMHPDDVAEAILAVLTSPTHIEDLAVLEDPAPFPGVSTRAE